MLRSAMTLRWVAVLALLVVGFGPIAPAPAAGKKAQMKKLERELHQVLARKKHQHKKHHPKKHHHHHKKTSLRHLEKELEQRLALDLKR